MTPDRSDSPHSPHSPHSPDSPDRPDGSDSDRRPDRRSRLLWSILLTLAAAAVVINVVVIDSIQLGFLIPILVAVSIALFSGDRPGVCGRRHAK